MSRLLSEDLFTHAVEPDGASVPLGTAVAVLASGERAEVGLWEAGPGEDTDVEVDEVFVVLSGAGTVTFASGESVALRPGVVVQLRAGDRTTWVVTERLRKLYVATGAQE